MIYPPYCDLCVLGFTGSDEQKVRIAAREAVNVIREMAGGEYKGEKIIVLGPVPARVSKIAGRYRYRIIIKCSNSARFRSMISGMLKLTGTDARFRSVTVYADMNPDTVL